MSHNAKVHLWELVMGVLECVGEGRDNEGVCKESLSVGGRGAMT